MKILDEHKREIENLCRKHRVQELYAFGSIVRGSDFSETSDIDLIAVFDKAAPEGSFDRYMSFRAEIESLLGRNVDIVTVKNLRNRVFARELDRTKELVYAA